MPSKTQNPRTGDAVLSLANGTLSVENVILAAGQNLKAGTVVGVIAASGKYTQLATSGETGQEVAAGVLLDNVDATDGDTPCVVVARDAEVKADGLIWPAGISQAKKDTAIGELAEAHIILR